MLSREDNELFTRVGPGTRMGELLRRYWMPIAAAAEFQNQTIKPVRVLGEDLVLYKDQAGTFGLIDRHCSHRRADMALGYVEPCGMRCNYHGWLYNEKGRCIEQPYEDTASPESHFKDKIRIRAYPVEVKAGLIWTYMGPAPAPLVPNWEPFQWKNGFKQIVFAVVPCNWFQGQENSIDPVHFEWMHMNWSVRLKNDGGSYSPKHLKVEFDEFDYGFVYKRMREGMKETDPLWTVGRVCLWPNALFTGDHFEWRVPIDDENTLSVTWCFTPVPKERTPYAQDEIPAWHGPVKDADGRWITSHIMNQDFIAWAGQGAIADRTKEHLGNSDRGILMMRKRFTEDMSAIAAGRDPKAVLRDSGVNQCIPLPVAERKALTEGLTVEEMRKHPYFKKHLTESYIFQAGQPDHVRKLYEQAMGITL